MPVIPKFTFENVVKHPLIYIMIMLIAGLSYLFVAYNNGKEAEIRACKEDKEVYKKMYEEERALNNQLSIQLLIKNNIINNLPETVDSLAKKHLNERDN